VKMYEINISGNPPEMVRSPTGRLTGTGMLKGANQLYGVARYSLAHTLHMSRGRVELPVA
jgi:hypothetical protein